VQYRPLGRSGIEASIVGLGTWVTGGGDTWHGPDDNESVKATHAALDRGVTLIATKCGIRWEDDRGSFNSSKDGRDTYISLRPDTITIEVENSLKRLGVDFIDLLQCHRPAKEPENTPIPESMACFMDLKDQGKIRAVGVSNVSLEQLEAYRAAGDLASAQFRYSLIFRNHEADILPYCATHNIGTITYMSLEQGLLTGKVGMDRVFKEDDFRKNAGEWLPWFKLENRQRLLDMFAGWADLTEKYGCTVAQLVIAWTAAQPGATHVLCGTRTVEQGIENAEAGALELDPDDIQRIRDDAIALGDPA